MTKCIKRIFESLMVLVLVAHLAGCGVAEMAETQSDTTAAREESVVESAANETVSSEQAEANAEKTTAGTEEEAEPEEVFGISEGYTVTSLGVPTEESYGSYMINARNPWDMIIEDGKLHVGSGDYDINAGPVDMWCYDIATGEWSETGRANDEAILRFVRVGDKLMAPGIDSKGSWAFGNYYTFEEGAWTKFSLVPGAVHMYDIIEFEGGRFYGIGTDTDKTSPVQLTMDNDETFVGIPFIKEGEEIFGSKKYGRCRVYDFFVINGELYCMCQAHDSEKSYKALDAIFRYEEEKFQFVCTNMLNVGTTKARQIHIYEKVYFNDAYYYANGRLRKTTNLEKIDSLTLPESGDVEDLLLEYNEEAGKDEMYILTKKRSGKTYRSTIWKYIDDETYEVVCYLESKVPAMSFAKYGEDFYVGLGLDVGSYAAKMNLGEIVVLRVVEN